MDAEIHELSPLTLEQKSNLAKEEATERIMRDAVSVAKTIIDPNERTRIFVSLIDMYGFLIQTSAGSASEYEIQARELLEQIPQTGISRLQYINALTHLARRGNDSELRNKALELADDKEWADAIAKREQLARKATEVKPYHRHWRRNRSAELLEQAHAIATSEELLEPLSFDLEQTSKFLGLAKDNGAEVAVGIIKGELEDSRHPPTDQKRSSAVQGILSIAIGVQQGEIKSSRIVDPSKKVAEVLTFVKSESNF